MLILSEIVWINTFFWGLLMVTFNFPVGLLSIGNLLLSHPVNAKVTNTNKLTIIKYFFDSIILDHPF
mgnify:CR=1 FL=1